MKRSGLTETSSRSAFSPDVGPRMRLLDECHGKISWEQRHASGTDRGGLHCLVPGNVLTFMGKFAPFSSCDVS